jgi:ferredoxin-NADP reductase
MRSAEHWVDAIVERAADLSPTVRELHLRPRGGVTPWTVGSHLRVEVQVVGRTELRHYSLVGLPRDSLRDGLYRIAVKRAVPGRGGSRFMAALAVGATVRIAGPDNHFELPVSTSHTLLVAGGIGITPIVGMALVLAGRGAPLRMCYAAREDAELVFADTLRAALGDRLATFVDARVERIALDAEIAALPTGAHLLVCGPVPLLQAAQAAWARAGRPVADLRFETFGSSGNQPAQAFTVRLPRHQLEFKVPADRSLLDVLTEHGIEALHDCRRGECGLCALDILELQGRVDHRDVFFSEAEKQADHRLCTCVSRICGPGATVVLDTAWRPDIGTGMPSAQPQHAARRADATMPPTLTPLSSGEPACSPDDTTC